MPHRGISRCAPIRLDQRSLRIANDQEITSMPPCGTCRQACPSRFIATICVVGTTSLLRALVYQCGCECFLDDNATGMGSTAANTLANSGVLIIRADTLEYCDKCATR